MPKISINVERILDLDYQIKSSINRVKNVKFGVDSISFQIDDRILNRNNISTRLSSVSYQISNIEDQIIGINRVVSAGAISYRQTDQHVLNIFDETVGEIKEKKANTPGLDIKEYEEARKKREEVFKENDDDNTIIEGAVVFGSASTAGKILGMDASASAEGELIGGSVETKSNAKWSIEDGDFGGELGIVAEGHIAKGSVKGSIGNVGVEAGGTVGSVAVSGGIGTTLYKDGHLSPTIEAKIKAEATAAQGSIKAKAGDDKNNMHAEASGKVLTASAEAGVGVGVIKTKDESTGKVKTEYGVKAKAGAEAYLATGEISGGITVFGIKIDVSLEGKAGGAGATAEGKITTGGASGKIGAGLGLGAGVEINIDWSKFKLW